jgi:glutathione S-transferase
MDLSLYFAPQSCALVPYIALAEAAAPFELRPLNMRKGEHMTPEYLRLNPKHRVPLLLIDGEPLSENVAIQIWIARNFPHARLLPADPMQEVQAISLMAWFASGIHPALTPNARPERYCDLPDSAGSVRRCAQKLLVEHYRIADDRLAGREWFFEHFTAVDAYFFWCFRRGGQFGLDTSAFPHCTAHLRRTGERPSVQAAVAGEARLMAEFAKAA